MRPFLRVPGTHHLAVPTGRCRRAPALAGVALLVLAGCSSGPPAASAELPEELGPIVTDPVVEVDDNVFRSSDLTVAEGAEVEWVWVGRQPHDVVGDGFESPVQTEGGFVHTFTDVGVYPYVCRLHAGMEGRVVVAPAG